MSYKRLMLVDDDEDDRELFREALRCIDTSITCKEFDGALPAIKCLEGVSPEFDLIVLDLNMPIMSGDQLLKRIRNNEELHHIPVIILSTTSNKQILKETQELGAIGYYTKPHNFNELVRLLSSILNGTHAR